MLFRSEEKGAVNEEVSVSDDTSDSESDSSNDSNDSSSSGDESSASSSDSDKSSTSKGSSTSTSSAQSDKKKKSVVYQGRQPKVKNPENNTKQDKTTKKLSPYNLFIKIQMAKNAVENEGVVKKSREERNEQFKKIAELWKSEKDNDIYKKELEFNEKNPGYIDFMIQRVKSNTKPDVIKKEWEATSNGNPPLKDFKAGGEEKDTEEEVSTKIGRAHV